MHSRGITGRKSLPLPSGFAFSRHAITFIPRLSSAACNFSAKLSFPNSTTQAGSGSSLGSGSTCSCGSPLSGYHRVICPCALVRNFHLLTTKQNQKHAPGFRATSNDYVSTIYIYIYINNETLRASTIRFYVPILIKTDYLVQAPPASAQTPAGLLMSFLLCLLPLSSSSKHAPRVACSCTVPLVRLLLEPSIKQYYTHPLSD